MIGLVTFAALVMCGYGFGVGGLLGALTGFIATGGAGSGLAIALGAKGTKTSSVESRVGVIQRIGGLLTALVTASLAYIGGWKWGWLWAAAGYIAGMLITVLVGILFRRITSHESGTQDEGELDSVDIVVPDDFDLNNLQHVALIDEIRDRYSAVLSDETGRYGSCVYKPDSLLPYPKSVIRSALETLLDFTEERIDSPHLDYSIRSPQFAETLNTTLAFLDHYLDIPESELPIDPLENAKIGSKWFLRERSQ